MYVAVDGRVEGVGGVGDPLRADARATVDALHAALRASVCSCSRATTRASCAQVGRARCGIAAGDALGGP